MILIDTSWWIEYFNKGHPIVHSLIEERNAAIHDLVIGELAVGDLRNRTDTLHRLGRIKRASHVPDQEVLQLIEKQDLWGLGLAYIDVHLLASALITPDCQLWSRDKRLLEQANRLGIAFTATLQ